MHIWAARRNIPLNIIAPTMKSGPKAVGLMNHKKNKDPHHDKPDRISNGRGAQHPGLSTRVLWCEMVTHIE